MKIFHLEDSFYAAKISNLFKEPMKVHRAKNIIEGIELLDSDMRFDCAILDLDLDARFLPPELHDKVGQPGWVFYKYLLCVQQPQLINRTIILSALTVDFTNDIPYYEYNHAVEVVNKHNSDSLKRIKNFVNKCRG